MALLKKTVRVFCGAALCIAFCSAQTAGKQRQPATPKTALNEALSWLPVDTETVMATNGPFSLPYLNASPDDPSKPSSAMEWEQQMEAMPLFLFSLNNGGLSQMLKDGKVMLAVEGSRHFRPPVRLGAMRYEGCDIVLFEAELAAQGNEFLRNATGSATRMEKIAGFNVAVFKEELENDIWTTFVAFPRKNVVAVATSSDYLRIVLARMSGLSAGQRALPESLPEWRYISRSVRAWGVRHYDKTQARVDPSSPFQERAAANFPDPSAVGVAFSWEGDRKSIDVTYLSGIKDAREVFQRWFAIDDPSPGVEVLLRQAGPRAVQCSLSISNPEIGLGLPSVLSAMLGHGVFF
jgi:hypothetical protein